MHHKFEDGIHVTARDAILNMCLVGAGEEVDHAYGDIQTCVNGLRKRK